MHMVDEPASLATRRTVSSAALSSLSAISPAATIRSRMSTAGIGSATVLAMIYNVLYNTCDTCVLPARGASMSHGRGPLTRRTSIWRASSSRITNLTLLFALLLALTTGLGAVANGSERGRWIVVGHGVAA